MLLRFLDNTSELVTFIWATNLEAETEFGRDRAKRLDWPPEQRFIDLYRLRYAAERKMQVFFYIAYFVIGIAQLFAIIDGVNYAFGLGGFVSFLIAMFITYIPLLGAGAGVYGAVNAWDWSILQAVLLFFWYVPVVLLFAVFVRE